MTVLKHDQLHEMLRLQDENNKVVHPEWNKQGYLWLRAALVESAEGMDHVGWKWWKKQTPDWPQVQLELVDIWHFLLSHYIIEADGDLEKAASRILNEVEHKTGSFNFDGQILFIEQFDLVRKFEAMVGLFAARRVNLELFESAMIDSQLNWEDLAKTYVGKNVLNRFRQANGYKEGTYIKVWRGEEDNVHLAAVMETVEDIDHETFNYIWVELEKRYPNE